MFELDQGQSWVDTTPEGVAFIGTSVNRPAVAPPDRLPEAAQAYITTIRRDKNLFEVFIYLHLVTSNVGLLYRWDDGAVPRDMVTTLQQNALEFTETMGFMMSDLRYRQLSPEEKQGLFESTPVFHQDLSRFKAEEEIQEVEPEEIGESELVIEPIEEPAAEEVTAGDFVLEGEPEVSAAIPAEAEAPPQQQAPPVPVVEDEEVEEIFLEGVEEEEPEPTADANPPASHAPAPASVTAEEDILLDGLESEEESSQPAQVTPETDIIEEIRSEGEELLDSLEAQDEGMPASFQNSPPPPAQAPADEQTEDISIEGLIEDEAEAEAVAEPIAEALPADEATQEMDVPQAAIIAEQPSPSPAQVPTRVIPGRSAPLEPISDEFSSEDIQILVHLLTMM